MYELQSEDNEAGLWKLEFNKGEFDMEILIIKEMRSDTWSEKKKHVSEINAVAEKLFSELFKPLNIARSTCVTVLLNWEI